jgi:hypothetical protein
MTKKIKSDKVLVLLSKESVIYSEIQLSLCSSIYDVNDSKNIHNHLY